MVNRVVPLLLASGLLMVSCGGSDGGIEVTDPWGRSSPQAAANGALYMTLQNDGLSDTLLTVTTDACGAVELHSTVMEEGVMRMQMVSGGIDIPEGGEVMLEPGGLHVMCIDKQVDFVAGTMIAITLDFDVAPSQTVAVEIRDE